jgi:biotin carboxyl carrier protein
MLDQLNELARTMIAYGVTSLEVKGKGYAIRLVRAPGAMPVVAEATSSRPERVQAFSPATGPFHHRGGDDGLAVLERGAQVLTGEPLGYVGIGPVRLLCVSPAAGKLVGRLPSQGETVSTGDPLFTVETKT